MKDLLNRQSYLDLLKSIISNQCNNTSGYSFAIDGKWGCGKTWILTELENQFEEDSDNKYLIFHYNAWENDFYDEPLVAILSVMIEKLNKVTSQKSLYEATIDELLRQASADLLNLVSGIVKEVTKIDVEEIIKRKKGFFKRIKENTKLSAREINTLVPLQHTLQEVRNNLKKLSEKFHIILIVDELDRCLPEYAIKVLERLHHVFEDIDNLQVVLSIDKNQLDKTVKTIFGDDVNVAGYLTKFIDFTIKLPRGDIDKEKFDLLFDDYVKNFKYSNGYVTIKSTDDFLNELFAKTNIRRQIKIIEKAKLVHSLMPKTSNLTIDYMAIEIFLTMISFVYDLDVKFNKQITDFNDVINLKSFNERELWVVANKVFYEEPSGGYARCLPPREDRNFYLFNSNDIWAALFLVMLKQYDVNKIKLMYRYETGYHMDNHYMNQIINYSKQFFEILKIVS